MIYLLQSIVQIAGKFCIEREREREREREKKREREREMILIVEFVFE
jgi:hypothetical protein